ncbi:unnamed protein product [Blepharisma stoltei]|uniref:Uncharacterized protein n=1 Tax=Blepharisma stoltei TaxID=1481888 RepID=A0AAU9JXR2_9CILI|nr:unnamed protein product [Blepharisma stoltei]
MAFSYAAKRQVNSSQIHSIPPNGEERFKNPFETPRQRDGQEVLKQNGRRAGEVGGKFRRMEVGQLAETENIATVNLRNEVSRSLLGSSKRSIFEILNDMDI